MQSLAMSVPLISMAWAMAGGWEADNRAQNESQAEAEPQGGTANATAAGSGGAGTDARYDAIAVVALHGVLLVPPILAALPVEKFRRTLMCIAQLHGLDSYSCAVLFRNVIPGSRWPARRMCGC